MSIEFEGKLKALHGRIMLDFSLKKANDLKTIEG